MAKFHINGNGEAGQCKAEKGGCPFGGENEHFESAADARTAFESSMTNGSLSSVSKTSFAPLPELTESEEDVLDLYNEYVFEDELEIADHSGLASGDWITLAELRDNPEALGNNCQAVSAELGKELVGGDEKVELLTVHYEDGYLHNAVSITLPTGSTVVLDFTAAQYDPSLPIPFVAEKARWRDTIAERVLAKHGTTIAREELESAG